MKRIIAVLLTLTLTLSLFGCQKTPEQLFESATEALAEENYTDAIENLEKLLENEPQNKEALNAIANAYYKSGDKDGFLKTYAALGSPIDGDYYEMWAEMSGARIEWKDPTMEAYVREYLGKPEGAIVSEDLDEIGGIIIIADLYEFIPAGAKQNDFRAIRGKLLEQKLKETDISILERIPGGTVNSIEDVKHFKNLDLLCCQYNNVSDLSPLADKTELTLLSFSYNEISDLTPLTGLTKLTYLTLNNNPVSNAEPLAGMKNLEFLELIDTTISDVTPFAQLTSLTNLAYNAYTVSDADTAWLRSQLPNCGVFPVS